MLSVVKAAKPMPRKRANEIMTSDRLARHHAIRLRSIARSPPWPSLPPLVVQENRAARDRKLAGLEAVANLDTAVLLHSGLHHAAAKNHRRFLHPHGGMLTVAHDRLGRHGGGRRWIAGGDLEAR